MEDLFKKYNDWLHGNIGIEAKLYNSLGYMGAIHEVLGKKTSNKKKIEEIEKWLADSGRDCRVQE